MEGGPDMTDQERAEIAEAVSAAVDSYFEAAKQLDFEGASEFWANTDGFVIAGDGTLIDSYEVWMSQIEEVWAGIAEYNRVESINPHVYVLARDAAVYSMKFEITSTSTEGEIVNMHGSWTYVFKHLNGRWRVVHSAGTHLVE